LATSNVKIVKTADLVFGLYDVASPAQEKKTLSFFSSDYFFAHLPEYK
jgi:hypothetical protein